MVNLQSAQRNKAIIGVALGSTAWYVAANIITKQKNTRKGAPKYHREALKVKRRHQNDTPWLRICKFGTSSDFLVLINFRKGNLLNNMLLLFEETRETVNHGREDAELMLNQ